jgi:hypothetical protein
VKISETLMTPADASKLLEANTKNRTLSQQRVTAIADAITRGEWKIDGNPLKKSKAGRLLDGQHRAAAIVRAGIPVPVLLIDGLDDDAQLVVDSGKSRTFEDYLTIQGLRNASALSGVTRLLWKWRNGVLATVGGGFDKRLFATNTHLWELYCQEQEAITEAVSIARRVIQQVKMSRAVAGVAWMILRDIGEDDAEDFFQQLAAEKTRCSQTQMFVRYIDNRENVAYRKGQLDQQFQMAVLFKTWNAYRDGREMGVVRWSRGGANRESFPEPH